MKNDQIFSGQWLGRPLTFKTGKLAQQATAALTVHFGESVVLATVVESTEERGGLDFFPLSVDFEEKLYAAGIIKGSRWVKREGRPTDESVLTGRMIDRSIRPLFNQSNRRDVQVVITALSVDNENDFDIVALIGASAVLAISGIDWAGPLSGVRVGRVEGEFVFNPTYAQRVLSDLDLIVAGTPERVLMIEADANEIKEADMLIAINAGREALRGAYDLIVTMQTALNVSVRKIVTKDIIASIEDADKMYNSIYDYIKATFQINAVLKKENLDKNNLNNINLGYGNKYVRNKNIKFLLEKLHSQTILKVTFKKIIIIASIDKIRFLEIVK
jgi:polyribonucleotide nucleotidyltransferase